jgi:hypothetical protein
VFCCTYWAKGRKCSCSSAFGGGRHSSLCKSAANTKAFHLILVWLFGLAAALLFCRTSCHCPPGSCVKARRSCEVSLTCCVWPRPRHLILLIALIVYLHVLQFCRTGCQSTTATGSAAEPGVAADGMDPLCRRLSTYHESLTVSCILTCFFDRSSPVFTCCQSGHCQ